jgi:Skp family chaperone for outer membrane proteins
VQERDWPLRAWGVSAQCRLLIAFPAEALDCAADRLTRWSRKTDIQQGALNVKTHLARATVVACFTVAVLAAASAPAQAPRQPSAPDPGVRVIDINKIFKNHHRFKGQMDQFREYFKSVEADLQRKGQAIEDMRKELSKFKPNSAEYRDLEKRILDEQGKLTSDATIKKKDLLEREAKIYYHTYQEIQSEVDYYCKVKGVSLVIRYTSDSVDLNDRASVMRYVANPIVVQKNIDITETILRVINRTQPGGGGPPSNPNVSERPGLRSQ